jgi:hypothetical protein
MTFCALYTDMLRNDIKFISKSLSFKISLVYWAQVVECWIDLNTGVSFETKSPVTSPFSVFIGGVFIRFIGSGPLLPGL